MFPPATLTELEGAILSEIHHRAHRTAFQVKRAFQISPSTDWRGSAGSVYPAIKRLTRAGLIDTTPIEGGRKALSLEVTAAGIAALRRWACDPQRAAGVGLDPFRLRSGIWRTLSKADRIATLEAVAAEIRGDSACLGTHTDDDALSRTRDELAIRLQRTRLEWIADELRALRVASADNE